MIRLPRRRAFRVTPARFTITLLAAMGAWLAYNVYSDRHAWKSYRYPDDDTDLLLNDGSTNPALQPLTANGTEVQKDFAQGVFRQGDDVEVLLARHSPKTVIKHPPYLTLFFDGPGLGHYFGGVEVVANNKKLVRAQTSIPVTDHHWRGVYFFGKSTPLELEYSKSFLEAALRNTMERPYASMAVAGFGAAFEMVGAARIIDELRGSNVHP